MKIRIEIDREDDRKVGENEYEKDDREDDGESHPVIPNSPAIFNITLPANSDINTVYNRLIQSLHTFISDNNFDGSQDFVDDADDCFINDDSIDDDFLPFELMEEDDDNSNDYNQ